MVDRLAALSKVPYAHRGLHDSSVPENSLAAFRGAIAKGLGIECDVRKSSDGRAMVFHDAGLDRLTGRSGAMGALPVGELTTIRLTGSDECIPTLRDLLDLVAGQVPILIEVKIDNGRQVDPLCRAVRRDLDGYAGPVGVMSFDPRVAVWFTLREPEIPAGLVITEENARTLMKALALRTMAARSPARFLALDVRDLPSRIAQRALAKGRPLFSWTVRSAEQLETVLAAGAQPIMEGAGVAAWEAGH